MVFGLEKNNKIQVNPHTTKLALGLEKNNTGGNENEHTTKTTTTKIGWDVDQLVRASDHCVTDAGLIPFFPESTFSADSLSVSIHPHAQSHALTSACTIKIL